MGEGSGAAWLMLSRDMNADGQFTLTDVWLWPVRLFFLPGDGLLWLTLTYTPGLARFLELGSASYGGLFSAIISAAAWLFAFVLLGAAYSLVLDLDRALTQSVARYYGEWLRRGRIARRWVFCQAQRLRSALASRRQRAAAEVDLGELELDDLDLEVLRSHALLAPGYVLSVSDLAASLEIRRPRAQQVLDRLEKLALLQRALGTQDGETGYRLSRPGRFVLMARSRVANG